MAETSRRLILASGSTYKHDLMTRLGWSFEAIPSYVDEAAHEGETPEATARRLAKAKAISVRDAHPNAWVVGADQIIHLDGQIFHKPETPAKAVQQLGQLAGKTHTLLTAVAVASPDTPVETELVRFEMEMRALTKSEIETYVEQDQPIDCAGSYKIESGGIRLFRRVDGDDYTAVVGLPLTRVWALLESTGFIDHGTT